VLCQYVPTELAKEIIELAMVIELRRVATLNRRSAGFYGRHILDFGILRFTPKYIDALSDLGVAILGSIMFMFDDIRCIKKPFLFGPGRRKELLRIIESPTKRTKNILLLGTLLKKAVVYDLDQRRFLIQLSATRTLYYNIDQCSINDLCMIDPGSIVALLLSHSVLPWRNVCARCFDLSLDLLSFCKRCKSVAYCCRECQSNDWSSHKFACKPVKKIE
jgi:hypothetical protein